MEGKIQSVDRGKEMGADDGTKLTWSEDTKSRSRDKSELEDLRKGEGQASYEEKTEETFWHIDVTE